MNPPGFLLTEESLALSHFAFQKLCPGWFAEVVPAEIPWNQQHHDPLAGMEGERQMALKAGGQ